MLAACALVVAATLVGVWARSHLAAPDFVMLYLLAIVVAATRWSLEAALVASTLSVLGYDFFFVPPFHTFAVSDERHLLTFATLFVVAVFISVLTSRIRRHEAEAVEREKHAAALELRAKTEEMRSSLLSAVSHDLRTPLGAITGAATTLRDAGDALEADQRAELVATVCEEAERLERFVANLLEMTRLDSGALEVKREWVPIEELIGSALTRLEARLEGRPVRAELKDDLPLVSVDPVLIEQVFYNLLDNAVKHTPPSSAIDISAEPTATALVIEFADCGPGLPTSETRLFDKFSRGPDRRVKGAGLGLAICRGIVEAHGGIISAHPRRGAGGSIFRVSLPLRGTVPSVPAEIDPAKSGAPP
jgi:two-component system sensor histidine kinase KdpD